MGNLLEGLCRWEVCDGHCRGEPAVDKGHNQYLHNERLPLRVKNPSDPGPRLTCWNSKPKTNTANRCGRSGLFQLKQRPRKEKKIDYLITQQKK